MSAAERSNLTEAVFKQFLREAVFTVLRNI